MTDREKLIELLCEANSKSVDAELFEDSSYAQQLEIEADHLIANGVTVQEGKPLEEFLHPIDPYKGLKAKYLVFKADTGEEVVNCFVLRPGEDPAAVEALRAYANATDNETLTGDIYNWVGKGEPVQEWIPVTERLPDEYQRVLALLESKLTVVARMFDNCWIVAWNNKPLPGVTHWMPLPEPPKGD